MKAYKGFDKNLQCRDFQFEVGKEYEQDTAEVCRIGFHACEVPLEVLKYYPPATSRYCEVELGGKISYASGDSKVAASKIKINTEIEISELVKAHIAYVKSHTKTEYTRDYEIVTAGNYGTATAGDYGSATAGDGGAATAGNYGMATAGNCGAATAGSSGIATVGDNGVAIARDYGTATAGNYGTATAGDYGVATARENVSVGKYGCAIVRGNNVKARGDIGAVLTLCEENKKDFNIKEQKTVFVDGETIKPNTWYMLKDDEVIEKENA